MSATRAEPDAGVRALMRLPANQLTALRLALIFVLWALVLLGRPALVGPLLLLAASTDVVDGFIARRTHTATRFGSAFDSVADHLLSASTLLFLVLLRPEFVREQLVPLAAWTLLGAGVLAVGWIRHRRVGNLHLYSAKLAGVVCYAFAVTLFFFETYSRAFFAVALGLAFLAAGETLLVLLTRGSVDERAGSILLPRRRRSGAGPLARADSSRTPPLRVAHPHRPETAGRHMVTDVPRARRDEGAAGVLARLAAHPAAHAETVYVVDSAGRLEGTVAVPRLVGMRADDPVGPALEPARVHVGPDADQEHVASLALRHGLDTVPVVDAEGRFLGVVPPLAMLRVLRREHVEDLHRLAGIARETGQARHALEEPPVRRVADRLPWLLLGLVGSTVATLVMARFEEVLRAQVAVAFFIPGIVYLADAVGTQTETVVVRGLSLSQVRLPRLLWGELRAGLLIGGLFGALVFPAVLLGFGDARLALAVAAAVVVAGTLATSIGLLFPWVLQRLGIDPAFGSGPLATVVQDVMSLLVYLAVCIAVL